MSQIAGVALGNDQLNDSTNQRVVYLLGAGATQGCVTHEGSSKDLVMAGLFRQLSDQMRLKYIERYSDHPGIRRLVNELLTSESQLDIEQLITFLEESPSRVYRDFSSDLKEIFSLVLRSNLEAVKAELGHDHSRVYAALTDMHNVEDLHETLGGFLTLNYDVFLEHAISEHLSLSIDYGIESGTVLGEGADTVTVLKMHGSFGWTADWPVRATITHGPGLWIPPGIRKPKNDYPFNAIWGRARELLDCDILRIVGCSLGSNDWDLISLLFSTRHAHSVSPPYQVEVITRLDDAERVKKLFPYLDARSILDLPEIGEQVVAELLGGEPQPFESLPQEHQREALRKGRKTIDKNPFAYWLTQKGEWMLTNLSSIATPKGVFEDFMDLTS